MDDIYGDLENYNDVNALHELRNENMELKSQMQEKSLQIDKLQKDYDKLASDYKKLEINYSSLLKTARAEVERKTQMINNLNAEKDMLVLNTIQNCKSISNIRRNMSWDRVSSYKKNKKDYDSDDGKPNKIIKDMKESKKIDTAKNRNEENRLPSVDTVSSTNTDDSNKLQHIEHKQAKMESYVEDNGESKENIARVKPRAQSIRNRRKSMPVPSKKSAKICSDEDDDNHSPENTKRKDWIPKEDKNRRVFDRNYNDKQSHKVSETSGIDDKYSSHHESSKETCYKSKNNRYSDKYRGAREKNDPMQRHRKRFSPERSHRRMPRDDRHPRSDFGRQRVLESPPFERYDQRRRKDRRPNYDKENPEDRHTKRRYETHVVNRNAQSDCDEPNTKRARTDSFNRHHEEDRRQCKDNEIADRSMTHRKFENLQDISCQSPDYVHFDTDLTHRVKEIMDTAATHLEDPRLTSKKYMSKTEDDKVILSTVDGRNVDLKVVDTSTWDIPRIDVPEALQRPPGYVDEIVREVYNDMDIDNPVSNLSMESGEIHSETNDASLMNNVTESYFNDYANERSSQKSVGDYIVDVHHNETAGLFDKSSKLTRSAKDYTKYNEYEVNSLYNSKARSVDIPRKDIDTLVNYENSAKSTKNYIEGNENERILKDTKHSGDKNQKQAPKDTLIPSKHDISTKTEIPVKDNNCEKDLSSHECAGEQINVQEMETENSSPIGNPPMVKLTKYVIPNRSNRYMTDNEKEINTHTQRVSKKHSIDEQRKETKKSKSMKCKISKNAKRHVNDKATEEISQQDNKDHIVNAQQGTANMFSLENPTKNSKYKIPKVKKPDKYEVSESITSDVKPLGRLLDEFNSTTKANKKPKENVKKNKSCDLNKLTSKQDVDKRLDIDNGNHPQMRNQTSYREVVEGDLELSDETSDNVEMNTHVKSKFECIGQPSPEHTDDKEIADDKCKKGGDHAKNNKKTEQCSNNIKIIIKRVSEEKTEEQISEGSKKQKTKKKSHKHKGGKETSKSKEIEQTTNKNIPKKETPKEIKVKFTDLFGDSSSLITPEDLGVITAPTQSPHSEKYVSIFEDAQDAIDVNVNKIYKDQTSSYNSSSSDSKVEVKTKEKQEPYSFKTSQASMETTMKKSNECSVGKSVPIMDTVEAANLFVNLIPDIVAKESDVVNTVIISTGVQPPIETAGIVEPYVGKQIKNNLVNEEEKRQNNNDVAAFIQQLPLALATSTPYKELNNIQIEAGTRILESNTSSSDNKVVRDGVTSLADQTSSSNGLDTQNEADAPDVRIFVRRRRKVVKKT